MEGKLCCRCDTWYPLEEYYSRANAPDGKMYHCKVCHAELNIARRARLHTEISEQDRLYRKSPAGREVHREARLRRRACTPVHEAITAAEWLDVLTVFNNKCAYCGKQGILTQDHVVLVNKGGKHTSNNLVQHVGAAILVRTIKTC